MDFIIDFIDLLTEPWLYAVALAVFLIITLLEFLFYKRPAFAGRKKRIPLPQEKDSPGVSVVLCVRNEYENLTQLLPTLLEQEYPKFQIVVVNKNSEDNTEVLLASLEHFHKNLTIRNITANRKFGDDSLMALGIGIRASVHPYVVFFRPDCRPTSDQWLSSLVKTSTEREAETVAGYTSLHKNSFWVRHHSLELQLHQMGMLDVGLPYVSNGNNVLFPKKRFTKGEAFKTGTTAFNRCTQAIVSHVLSNTSEATLGLAKKSRAAACAFPQGTTVLVRQIPYKEYRFEYIKSMQTLWLTKSRPFLLLTLEKFLTAAFYTLLAFLILTSYPWQETVVWAIPAGLFLLRWIFVWIFHLGYRLHLGEKIPVFTAPLWDVFSPLMHFYYLIVLLFKKIKHR